MKKMMSQRLDVEVLERIKQLSNDSGLSHSQVIELAINKLYIKVPDKPVDKIAYYNAAATVSYRKSLDS